MDMICRGAYNDDMVNSAKGGGMVQKRRNLWFITARDVSPFRHAVIARTHHAHPRPIVQRDTTQLARTWGSDLRVYATQAVLVHRGLWRSRTTQGETRP